MTRLFAFGMIVLFVTTFPAAASAQPQVPIVDPGSQAAAETQVSTTRDPHRYLATARQQLQAVPTQNLSKDARKKLDQLREDFERLATSYEQRSLTAPNSRSSATGGVASSMEAVNWKLQFDAVERDLVDILGAGPELGADATPAVAGTSGVAPMPDVNRPSQPMGTAVQPGGTAAEAAPTPVPQPVGASSPLARTPPSTAAPPDVGAAAQAPAGSQTAQPSGSPGAQAGVTATTNVDTQAAALAGVAVAKIGVKNLDPAVREQLEEMRNSVEMFYDATTSLGHR